MASFSKWSLAAFSPCNNTLPNFFLHHLKQLGEVHQLKPNSLPSPYLHLGCWMQMKREKTMQLLWIDPQWFSQRHVKFSKFTLSPVHKLLFHPAPVFKCPKQEFFPSTPSLFRKTFYKRISTVTRPHLLHYQLLNLCMEMHFVPMCQHFYWLSRSESHLFQL